MYGVCLGEGGGHTSGGEEEWGGRGGNAHLAHSFHALDDIVLSHIVNDAHDNFMSVCCGIAINSFIVQLQQRG